MGNSGSSNDTGAAASSSTGGHGSIAENFFSPQTASSIPKSPAQLHQYLQTHIHALHSTSSLNSPSHLRRIVNRYEELVPIRLHVVLFYELAVQLMYVLREKDKRNSLESEINLEKHEEKREKEKTQGMSPEMISVNTEAANSVADKEAACNVAEVESQDKSDPDSPAAGTGATGSEERKSDSASKGEDTAPTPPSKEATSTANDAASSKMPPPPINLGAQHLELTPEWTQFLIELLQRAIESFELYCVPVGTNNGDMHDIESGKDKSKFSKKDSAKNSVEKGGKNSSSSQKKADSDALKAEKSPGNAAAQAKSSNHQENSGDTKSETEPVSSNSSSTSPAQDQDGDIFTSTSSLEKYLAKHMPNVDTSSLKLDSSLHELYIYYLKSHVQLAHLLYERKQYKEALTHYVAGQYRNHFRLACLYYGIDEYAQAIAEYKKIPNYESDIYALNNIGVAHEEMGEWSEARKYYEQALKLDSDYGMARLNLRSVAWKIEQKEKYSTRNKSKAGKKGNSAEETDDHLGFSGVSSSDVKLKTLQRKMSLGIITHMEYSRLADEAYYYLPSITAAGSSTSSNKHHTHTHHRKLPPHWEVLVSSDRVSLARNGYFSIAFVNHLSRSVIISTRGTDDGAGVRADFWLTFDEFSIQFALARGFSRMVRLIMRNRGISSYKLSYTGHSLGASIGAFLCWEEGVSGVTFDSPGCRKLIEIELLRRQLRNQENPSHDVKETLPHAINPFSVDVITYLTAPNLINTIKPHVGLRVRMFPSSIDDPSQQAAIAAATGNPASASKALPFYVRWVAPTTALQSFEYVYKELDKLIQHTSQQHVMKNIVKTLSEPNPKELILSWPCGPFQCWTFYKGYPKLSNYTQNIAVAGGAPSGITAGPPSKMDTNSHRNAKHHHHHKQNKQQKKKDQQKQDSLQQHHPYVHNYHPPEPSEQEAILRSVFEDSVHNMAQYRTTYYDESTIPLYFFSREEVSMLKRFAKIGEHAEILSNQNTKLLHSYKIEECLIRVTSFLTGCEFKQFIKLNKEIMKDLISKYSPDSASDDEVDGSPGYSQFVGGAVGQKANMNSKMCLNPVGISMPAGAPPQPQMCNIQKPALSSKL